MNNEETDLTPGETYRTTEPTTRLAKLTVRMTECLEEPENQDVKAIVFLNDEKGGGCQIHGYGEDGDLEAMVDVFVHLKHVFKANGKDLELVGIPNSPEGIDGD